MVCPMRFFLVAASAAVALLSALAGLLGWSQPKGGKYGSDDESDDESGGEDGKVGNGDEPTSTTTPSPRARRRRRRSSREKPQNGEDSRSSARQLARMGLLALWDAFTGRYLARRTRDLWRAAKSRSASPSLPQPRGQEKEKSEGRERLRRESSKAE